MQGIHQIYKVTQSIAPAAITASTNGAGVDLANVNANEFVISPGVRTDGTHTPKLQESSDNSTFTDVAAADQVGSFAAIASNVVQSVSYIGSKRYVRVVSTVATATSGAVYGAFAVTKSRKQP